MAQGPALTRVRNLCPGLTTAAAVDDEAPPRIPMWVKILGGMLLLVLGTFLALHFTGRMAVHH